MQLISFEVSGAFAAFKDPTVTTNQTVYYIPSKSAVIGFLGAMIGVERDNSLGKIYGPNYLKFFSETKIGLSMLSEPKKVTYFTNHRSLKEPKTKPFKTELVENPKYRIYVLTGDQYSKTLENAVRNNNFAYSPYLGHAYCPASISLIQSFDVEYADSVDNETDSVILDESETYKDNFGFDIYPTENGRIIIERHLHHFLNQDKLDSRVLKHWIPIAGSRYIILKDAKRDLSKFVQVKDKVVCLY